jgi:hypothetical protein
MNVVSRSSLTMLATVAGVMACGGGADGTTIPSGAELSITVAGLATPGQTAGTLEVWLTDAQGNVIPLGTLAPGAGSTLIAPSPVDDPRGVVVTWEREGDTDPAPSPHRLLAGQFRGDHAELSVVGALTQGGLPLNERPGQFTMFSPSDNDVHGYPSFEESGVWLFNMEPRTTVHGDMWVRLAQLREGWVYEGWMVRDIDSPTAIWLSYGKFMPDQTGAVNARDDTGWGPFSGVLDYATAGEEEFPGDDWISNPLSLPFPGGLELPLDLRERDDQGRWRWTHMITIEPSSDRGEPVGSERPFLVRPYRDAFGGGAPGAARTITFRADAVPNGTAQRR